MTNTGKARSTAATVERAKMEAAACGGAAISTSDCTTGGAERQPGSIESLLSHGAENGLTLSDLHRLTGMDKRIIRSEIQRERLSGVPILTDNINGYFLPANEQEQEQCVRSLRHRAGEILAVASAIERGAVN